MVIAKKFGNQRTLRINKSEKHNAHQVNMLEGPLGKKILFFALPLIFGQPCNCPSRQQRTSLQSFGPALYGSCCRSKCAYFKIHRTKGKRKSKRSFSHSNFTVAYLRSLSVANRTVFIKAYTCPYEHSRRRY